MPWLNFFRRRREEEFDAEIDAHIAAETRLRIERGETPESAATNARRDFGNIGLIKEVTRETWGWMSLERLNQDIQYALRGMRRSPGASVLVLMSLALAIGANTAIFSLIHAVLLKNLPVTNPEQLVEFLWVLNPDETANSFSYPALDYFRNHTKTLQSVIGSARNRFYVEYMNSAPERVNGQFVTGNYFEALGVQTTAGRPINLADDRMGSASAVAVIGYGTWQNRFGGDPGVIGKTVKVEEVPLTIIGVAPPEFHGTQVGLQNDLWIPLAMEPRMRQRSMTTSAGYKWIQLLGRLKSGTSIQSARAELQVLFRQAVIETELPLQSESATRQRVLGWTIRVEPASHGLSTLPRQFSRPLLILMTVVLLVLLIACSNVANLLLARASARQREIAIRKSVGAGRARLIRQLLTESLVLSGLAGVLGFALASQGTGYLIGYLASGRNPVELDIHPDFRVLSFTLLVSVITGLIFGIVPAFRASNAELSLTLKAGVETWNKKTWTSRGLITIQIAVLVVLCVGAGLFLRSLYNLKSIPLGFEHEHVLVIALDPAHSGYRPNELRTLYMQLISEFEGIPGVQSASRGWTTPISGGGSNGTFTIDRGDSISEKVPDVWINWVAPKFFATLETPILAGRDFTFSDTDDSPHVAMVNQAFARRRFGTVNPIGRRIFRRDASYEIIGVVADTKYLDVREEIADTVYFSSLQEPSAASQFIIRVSGDAASIAPAIRSRVQDVAPRLGVTDLKPLTQQVNAAMVRERLLALLAGAFGILALLLAALGLYGVVAYRVMRRTKEFGIRTALGALPGSIVRMVLRETLVLLILGVSAGLVLALFLGRFVATLLYGIRATDPFSIAAAVLVLITVTMIAGFIPAMRAARVDPLAALRED